MSSCQTDTSRRITVLKKSNVLNPPDAPISYSAQYCAGPEQRELDCGEVAQMEKTGVSTPVVTKWALPIVIVLKLESSVRVCVDFCRLDAVTVRDSYPIACIYDWLVSLEDFKLFATLVANSVYTQIETDKGDIAKMAFVTLMVFLNMAKWPIGLKLAPAIFQRAMDEILEILDTVKEHYAIDKIDDSIIIYKTPKKHREHFEKLLSCGSTWEWKLGWRNAHSLVSLSTTGVIRLHRVNYRLELLLQNLPKLYYIRLQNHNVNHLSGHMIFTDIWFQFL